MRADRRRPGSSRSAAEGHGAHGATRAGHVLRLLHHPPGSRDRDALRPPVRASHPTHPPHRPVGRRLRSPIDWSPVRTPRVVHEGPSSWWFSCRMAWSCHNSRRNGRELPRPSRSATPTAPAHSRATPNPTSSRTRFRRSKNECPEFVGKSAVVTHSGAPCRAAGLLPIALPLSVRNSTAPGPSRIRDFRHRLLCAVGHVRPAPGIDERLGGLSPRRSLAAAIV